MSFVAIFSNFEAVPLAVQLRKKTWHGKTGTRRTGSVSHQSRIKWFLENLDLAIRDYFVPDAKTLQKTLLSQSVYDYSRFPVSPPFTFGIPMQEPRNARTDAFTYKHALRSPHV